MILGKKRWRVKSILLDFYIRHLNEMDRPVHYVQVGANDGVLDDPAFRAAQDYGWSGLLIEPVPEYYRRLVEAHQNHPSMTLVNAGVSDEEGQLSFHYLLPEAEDRYPNWAKGCASTDRNRLAATLQRAGPFEEGDIISADVDVMRLDHLLRQHQISRTDMLIIDVEGHELPVLNSFDLAALAPRLIIVESNSGAEHEGQIRDLLVEAKYQLGKIGDDIVGFSENYPAISPEKLLPLIGFARV